MLYAAVSCAWDPAMTGRPTGGSQGRRLRHVVAGPDAVAVLVHVAAVIVGVGDVGQVGLPAWRWRRSHKDAARATSLLREPCPRSTEWRGPPSRLNAVEALRPAPGELSAAIVHRLAPSPTGNPKREG
jgi:hypothetical protein